MGVKLDSNVISSALSLRARSLETTQPPAAPQQAPQPAAAVPSAYHRDSFESVPATRPGMPALNAPQPVNEAAEAQEAQLWQVGEAAVAQKTEIDCGESALTMLEKVKDRDAAPVTDDQKRQEVDSAAVMAGVNLKDGARPEEMAAVLGSMGIGVKAGIANYDTWAISEGLKAGQLGMAMVDSNVLANLGLPPGQQKQGPGALHWITIDGFNKGQSGYDTMDDQFRVKDSAGGEYWVSQGELLKAMDVARREHGASGGMMLLQNRPDVTTQEARAALSRENQAQTEGLGKGNGIGSKRLSTSESS